IGPNGAGKTTLFNCICGLYRPDRGTVRFHGEPLLGFKPDAVARRGIARTFQNIELFLRMTVIENLLLGRHLHFRAGFFDAAAGSPRWRREEIRHREVASWTSSTCRRCVTAGSAICRSGGSAWWNSRGRWRPNPNFCSWMSRRPE
ncbi:MAG: ATP-binding cassette domain-containing protein, partial [Armatimonadetes bacterium]|nr:ATP-binding cassette domain-containing protein [Armatimonadota bacterium]